MACLERCTRGPSSSTLLRSGDAALHRIATRWLHGSRSASSTACVLAGRGVNRCGAPKAGDTATMSLAKRNNGCVQCRIRRIRCDKEEPECFKCRKKGICCSGQGIEYRFSSHMSVPQSSKNDDAQELNRDGLHQASPGSKPGRRLPRRPAQSLDRDDVQPSKPGRLSARRHEQASTPKSPSELPGTPQLQLQFRLQMPSQQGSHARREATPPDERELCLTTLRQRSAALGPLRGSLESVTSRSRMFFDHFSNFIAAKMVVFDYAGNGYRQIILPLACQDPMVEQAVSTVAAFHLAREAPNMREAAELAQQAVLTRLYRQSLSLDSKHLFDIAAWATILALLVGDTITGSKNYIRLLGLLSFLAKLSESATSLSSTTKAFISEQTRMFELFGLPLSSEQKGIEALGRCSEFYLDFMTAAPARDLGSRQRENIGIMKDAICKACDIYRRRALHIITAEQSIQLVSDLQETVAGLDPKEDGGHTLVWTYFVAAAESSLPQHRDFFVDRLKSLFECTRFGSIPIALETLDLIWSGHDSSHWTDVVTRQRPLLIM
ncbi:hypothetical protein JDV02_005560 [Purpureocillium takamizusanense]|uniref:Zn(2)-C6 fungal-type domain-containing protein n=1 Tax=Purpureocillium takamizusanense TaxID=2060973 RepID=A0A9Q8QEK5_9HYPO|nr:uncharacterized protein JDV02_005560 [Purpureocillium takamizusanense]UNI19374.1 hypothetical protein JDV02_005560 [Purpureocillium takamizusanense]